jgi:hypothetical protein
VSEHYKSLLKSFLQILHSGCELSVQELVKKFQEFVLFEEALVAFGLYQPTEWLSRNALQRSQTPVFLPYIACMTYCGSASVSHSLSVRIINRAILLKIWLAWKSNSYMSCVYTLAFSSPVSCCQYLALRLIRLSRTNLTGQSLRDHVTMVVLSSSCF